MDGKMQQLKVTNSFYDEFVTFIFDEEAVFGEHFELLYRDVILGENQIVRFNKGGIVTSPPHISTLLDYMMEVSLHRLFYAAALKTDPLETFETERMKRLVKSAQHTLMKYANDFFRTKEVYPEYLVSEDFLDSWFEEMDYLEETFNEAKFEIYEMNAFILETFVFKNRIFVIGTDCERLNEPVKEAW